MSVDHIEVLVEEPSMEAALRALLPKVVGGTSFEVYPYQGKEDLLSKLPERLRGYASWLPASWRVVVIVDRDDEHCTRLKAKLERVAVASKLVTRTAARGGPYVVANRIAIEELEAWYFGDWEAVRTAYPRVSARIPSARKYRDPDAVLGGTWEAFERVLQDAGYFVQGLAKIEAARAISEQMAPERNTSRSFQALRAVLSEMASP